VSQVILVGVVIGLYELLLRIINHLLSGKTSVLGNPKKNQRNHKQVEKDREKTQETRT